MKRCPQCSKTYPDAERFCPDDGTALVSAGGPATTRVDDVPGGASPEPRLECPVCGGKAEPGEVICNFCGARLDASAAPPPGPATPSGPLRSPTPGSTGTARVQHTFSDERPADEDQEPVGSRRWIGIIGYIIAALIALIGGAWLALHLTKSSSNAPVAEASPVASAATPTPAGVAAAPTVTLASTIPTQVSGPAAEAPERNRDAIEKVFDSNRAALLDIYGHALDTDSTAHDAMLVHVSIDAGGKVVTSSIKTSTAPNPSLDAEVLNSIATWDFGASTAGAAEADLPIVFSHGGAEATAAESALSAKLATLDPNEPPELALAAPSPTALPTPVAALPPPPVAAAPPPPRPRHRTRVASARPPRPTLLEKVLDRLRVDPRTRRVKAYTNSGGVVTLYGKVFDDKARRVAVNNVQGVNGVSDVIDNLTTDTGEWQQQQDAIMRQLQGAGLTSVTVKVIGKDAFLDGQVGKPIDRDRAVTITEGAAPVKVRTNLIRVVPGNIFGF